MEKLSIYTDGACSLKRKIAAFGVYIPEIDHKFVQRVASATNNQVEMMAFIYAIKFGMKHPEKETTIITDSQYCQMGCDVWMYDWRKSGIVAKSNIPLWAMVWDLKEVQGAKFTVKHMRGHGKGINDLPEDVKYNNIVDKLVFNATQ